MTNLKCIIKRGVIRGRGVENDQRPKMAVFGAKNDVLEVYLLKIGKRGYINIHARVLSE